MHVAVTGGTGFVGPAIVRALLAEGHRVTLLVHRDAAPFDPPPANLAVVRGDVTRPETLRGLFPSDAVVHLVALRRGKPADFERLHVQGTVNLLRAAKEGGVRRFLHMSAHGVKPGGTPYQRTKWQAEEAVKGNGIPWTIFRPTFITGPKEGDDGGGDHEFADLARKAPALPSFGGGTFPMQPVAKSDVAQAFVRALAAGSAAGKTYTLAGPDRLTWNEYLRAVCEELGVRRPLLPAPRWAVLPVAGLLGGFSWFPASRDELVMLLEGHAGDSSEAVRDLGLTLTPFRAALHDALAGASGSRTRRSGVASGG